MKYTKLITGLTALATTAMLFTGCGSATEIKVSLEVVGTEPVTNVTALETIPATEPIESQFEFGQELWVVEIEDGETWLSRYAFVGQKDETLVEAVPYFTPDVEQLREVLNENPCIYLIDMKRIYEDRYEAMAVVAEANGETFEEYWGEQN